MNARELMQRFEAVGYNPGRLSTREYDYSPVGPTNERTVFADFQARVPHSIRPDTPIDIAIPATERKDAVGDGTENTYSLSHPLTDDPAVANDLVLFADGNRVSPASVDYDNDTFSYQDDGTQQTLDVFYLSSEQAQLKLRINAPKNVHNDPLARDPGVIHVRDTNDDPITFDPNHPLEGMIPTDYTVEWMIEAPYQVRRERDNGAKATNLLLSLPIWKANKQIDGLDTVKRASVQ